MIAPRVVLDIVTLCVLLYVPATGEKVGVPSTGSPNAPIRQFEGTRHVDGVVCAESDDASARIANSFIDAPRG
jgi:hypothetical protein